MRIVFADKSGVADAIKFVQSSSQVGCAMELHMIGDKVPNVMDEIQFHQIWDAQQLTRIADALRLQPMGTKVSLFLSREMWKELYEICLSCGLSADEIEGQAYGPKRERVFCIGCYGLNPPADEERISCTHCGRVLSVSTHYSRRLDAVFGYLTIPQKAEVVRDDR